MPPEGASPGGEGCRGSPAACEGRFFSNQKNLPSRSPRKIVRGDGVVTSSLSLASSLRIAYPSKAPLVPSRSFHRSSSSRRKPTKCLRRELFLFRHRLTHSAAPPFPTAEVFAAGALFPPPDPSYDQRKGRGPSFGNHPEVRRGLGGCRPAGDGGRTEMRIAVTSAPNFGAKFGWRWLHLRCVASPPLWYPKFFVRYTLTEF